MVIQVRTWLPLAAAMVLAACASSPLATTSTSAAPAPSASSPASSLSPTSAPSPSALDPPLAVPTIAGVTLDNHPVLSVVSAPVGEVWAVVSDAGVHEGTSLWHGIPGSPGTLYRVMDVPGPPDAWGGRNLSSVALARDGRLWIAAGAALLTFDGHDWRRLRSNGLIGAPAVDPDGTVWVLGVGELLTCDETCSTVTEATQNCSDLAVEIEDDGTVWTSGVVSWWGPSRPVPGSDFRQLEGCVQRFDGIAWNRVLPPGDSWSTACLLVADPAGGVWAWLIAPRVRSDNKGIVEFRLPGRSLARYTNGAWATIPVTPRGDVTSMVAADRALWVVMSRSSEWACNPGASESAGRLFRFDGTTWTLVRTGVAKVHDARPDGSVWVTTRDGDLSLVDPDAIH